MDNNPFSQLIRSRKFWLLVGGVLVDLLVALVPPDIAPRITPMREQLVTVISALVGAVILGIAHEDANEKSAPTTIATGSGDVTVTPQTPSAPTVPPAA